MTDTTRPDGVEAIMELAESYCEKRHTLGAPEYNVVTARARDTLRAATVAALTAPASKPAEGGVVEALRNVVQRLLEAAETSADALDFSQRVDDFIEDARAALAASPPPTDAARASGDEPLTEFQEGQWWIAELDAMVKDAGTDDQKRAVAVVHHLLRASSASPAEPDAARVEADRREAALGRVALRFVDRAGDPVSGIDDAGTILREFHEAMTAALAAERNHGIRPAGGEQE